MMTMMMAMIMMAMILQKDYIDDHGNLFWSGNKLYPTATRFNPANPIHVAFVHYAALLVATCFGIESVDDEKYIVEQGIV